MSAGRRLDLRPTLYKFIAGFFGLWTRARWAWAAKNPVPTIGAVCGKD